MATCYLQIIFLLGSLNLPPKQYPCSETFTIEALSYSTSVPLWNFLDKPNKYRYLWNAACSQKLILDFSNKVKLHGKNLLVRSISCGRLDVLLSRTFDKKKLFEREKDVAKFPECYGLFGPSWWDVKLKLKTARQNSDLVLPCIAIVQF